MKMYEEKVYCSGCRACEQICPVSAISMVEDQEGFLYPEVDKEKCINCEKCIVTCRRIENQGPNKIRECYALKNKSDDIRKKSSSGGVFYELARVILELDGDVYGVAFDDEYQAMQKKITRVEDVPQLMGSKYVQSNTGNTFSEAKSSLENGKWVLYSGTPCQIAGLKSYLEKEYEKLLCVSVICHGVPSPMVWRRYVSYLKGRFGETNINSIIFRDKSTGWKAYSLKVQFEENTYITDFRNDLYGDAFLKNVILRPSCYRCRAKGEYQQADIILGDYWGIEKVHPKFEDTIGISAVILNSLKGKVFFEKIKQNFLCKESRYECIEKNQPTLEHSVRKSAYRDKFFESLKDYGAIDIALKENIVPEIIPVYERKQYQYDLIKKYLDAKIAGHKIGDALERIGFQKCVLYSIMDLTDTIYRDVKNLAETSQVDVKYICDKGFDKFSNGYYGAHVIGLKKLQELYRSGEIDGIVICNIYRTNEIIEELLECGIKQEHIISAATLIYAM